MVLESLILSENSEELVVLVIDSRDVVRTLLLVDAGADIELDWMRVLCTESMRDGHVRTLPSLVLGNYNCDDDATNGTSAVDDVATVSPVACLVFVTISANSSSYSSFSLVNRKATSNESSACSLGGTVLIVLEGCTGVVVGEEGLTVSTDSDASKMFLTHESSSCCEEATLN